MTLGPEELAILHSISQTVTNTKSYGYEIAKKMLTWAKREENASDSFSYVIAFIGIVVIFIASSLILTTWLHDPLMQIFAPEYVVVKEILKAAASVST